jgi:hypothetical protein
VLTFASYQPHVVVDCLSCLSLMNSEHTCVLATACNCRLFELFALMNSAQICVLPTACNCRSAHSPCRWASVFGRREPAARALLRVRHRRDHQVAPLRLLLEGCFRQGSTGDSRKLPGRRVRRWKWWGRGWVRWPLCCLRELLLLLSSGAYLCPTVRSVNSLSFMPVFYFLTFSVTLLCFII